MPCTPCYAECHFECELPQPDGFCCCPIIGIQPVGELRGGPLKSPEDMLDPISTGRKRAAIAKPITKGMVCEWSGLKFAGGGVEPIIGCRENEASDIHHGPDKDVLNNSDTNLHRVCDFCHNRWHTKNDKFYGARPVPGTPFIPLVPFNSREHDANTAATLEELVNNEIYWLANKPKKTKED